MRLTLPALIILTATLLAACVGGSKSTGFSGAPPPVVNTMAVTVDSGPPAAVAMGVTAINRPYVTVKVCVAGSQTCTNVDHVLLDTGSWGLRLVRSVLTAGGVTLSAETDAQGSTIEECFSFGGGDTWGPVALADVTLAGEIASKLPVQIMDDTNTGASTPATCGSGNPPINDVAGIGANGILGIGVFAQDCGAACVNAGTPLAVYYGCTTAGVCTPENAALADQVTNPVAMFAADNNGIIVDLPNLTNANGDSSVQGELIFGLATQADNDLPATGLIVLGADASGDFTTTYNGTALPALFDTGTEYYSFDDPAIAPCTNVFIGFYCPTPSPQTLSAVNAGVGVNNATSTVQFAIADPQTFVPNAAAYADLAGGRGSTRFTWGMPFFYGRKVYIGIDQRSAGSFKGPYYAY